MERLSLYNLLSVLLPGALLTLVIEIIAKDFGFKIENFDLNQYFTLTVFLSASIFLGSLINISTRKLLNLYKRIGLYTDIYTIYKTSTGLNDIKPFIETKINNKFKNTSFEEGLEKLWSEMYYELEATQKIDTPKSFQSFYFFFRNFFTLGIILILPLLFQVIHLWISPKHLFLSGINLFGIVTSIFASKWNRIKMVERMFWTYYSLNKKR